GSPRVTIQPRDVKADGTYTDTRRLTGIQEGGARIIASVKLSSLHRFDLTGTIHAVVNNWEARPRFRIAAEARDLIQRSVVDARRPLEDFLRQQELNGADPQSVFQALLAPYCYDLPDNQLTGGRSAVAVLSRPPVMLAVRQQPAASPEVEPGEVRRWSF